MPGDLEEGGGGDKKATPTSKSSAELERDLEDAKKQIAKHNAERAIFSIVLVIIWDNQVFKSYDGWAPVISILALELIGLFILAYRLEMHEVIRLFWGAMRAYGKQDPGDPP